MTIRTAVIGFGTGGAVFHAPFLAADDEFRLDLVVTGDAGRAEAAMWSYPGCGWCRARRTSLPPPATSTWR